MARNNTVEIILSARDRATRAVQSAMGSVRSSASVALGAIAKGAAAAGAAMATLTGVVSKVGVSYNAALEQSQVAWNTLLGSQEKAQKMLKDISDFAKATPFETADVDMMAKYMNNAGLAGQALFDSLMKVSDVAGAFAIPAAEAKEMTRQMSQVRQAGVAYTEDLNILQDRGVPIFKAIAEQVGINVAEVKKMASEGKITSDIYVAAFDSIAKGVEGASAAQSETFNGMISTLKDNLQMISGELMSGAFDRMKGALEAVMPILDNFLANLQTGGIKEAILGLFPPSFAEVASRVVAGFDLVKNTLTLLKDSFLQNKDAIIGTFTNIKDNVVGFVQGYIETVKQLFQGEGNLGQSFLRIFETFKSIALPIFQEAVAFIKQTLAELKAFWDENGAQIIAAVQNAWSVIASIFEAVAPVIKFIILTLFEYVKGVISGALDMIMGLVKIFAGLFTGDFSKMWEGIKQLFSGAVEFLWNLLNLMFVGRIISGIKSLATGAANTIKNMWTTITEFFKGLADDAARIITNMVNGVIGFFRNMFTQATTIFGQLRTFGASIWNAMSEAIRGVARNIWDGVTTSFTNMVSSIRNIFGTAKSTIEEIWNKVMDFFKGINLEEIGKNIMQGLVNGIGSMAGAVWKKVKEIADSVKDTIKDALKINSPSRVMRDDVGKWIPIGLAEGIETNIRSVDVAAKKMGDATVPPGRQVQFSYGSNGGSGTGNTYGDIYVTISARDILELNSLIDFFNRLQQEVRSQ